MPSPAAQSSDVAGSSYFGGKGSQGTFQTIINQIPPIQTLIVPCAGHCSVTRNIKTQPARVMLFDTDPDVVAWWKTNLPQNTHATIAQACALSVLPAMLSAAEDAGNGATLRGPLLIYIDAPYHPETRRSEKRYNCEFTPEQHEQLLQTVANVDPRTAFVMVSHYPHKLYAQHLRSWRTIKFKSMTRRGPRTEQLWMNYPQPQQLQDVSHLGANKREREKLLRRRRNLADRLRTLSPLERQHLLAAAEDAETCDPAALS